MRRLLVSSFFGDVTQLGKLFPDSAMGSYRLRTFDYEKHQDAPQPMGTFLLFRRTMIATTQRTARMPATSCTVSWVITRITSNGEDRSARSATIPSSAG